MMTLQSGPATERRRRYWAIRTDRHNRALLLDQVRQGRLRQVWGYDPSRDLRLIHSEIVKGGPWWELGVPRILLGTGSRADVG